MTTIIEFEEIIDLVSFRKVLKHWNEVKDQIGMCRDKNYNPISEEATLTILKRAYVWHFNNKIMGYRYAKERNNGRLISIYHSLQGLPRFLRHTIAGAIYWDIDLVNCHPVILEHLCLNELGLKEVPYLNDYIAKRDDTLQLIMKFCKWDKDQAKSAILSLMNGGNGNNILSIAGNSMDWIALWIKQFALEMDSIHKTIAIKYKDACDARIKKAKEDAKKIVKKDKISPDDALKKTMFNINGKVMNRLLCIKENEILQEIIKESEAVGLKVGVLCFDGLMVYKNNQIDITNFCANLSKTLSDKFEMKLTLCEKPMLNGADLTPFEGMDDNIDDILGDMIIPNIDNYFWDDFYQRTRRGFDNKEEMGPFLNERFPLVCNHISGGGGGIFICKESKNEPFKTYKARDFSFGVSSKETGNLKFNELFIVLDGLIPNIKSYREIVCQPNPTKLSDKEFNVWTPNISVTNTIDYDMGYIQFYLDFQKDIICDGNTELFNYLLQWKRQLILHPERKTEVALVYQSLAHGTGKNTDANFTRDYSIGKAKSLSCVGVKKVTGDFNGQLIGKALVVINEASAGGTAYHEQFDAMKDLITDDSLYAVKKGHDGLQIANTLNFIFTTQWTCAIKIEKSDRRYCVFKVNEKWSVSNVNNPLEQMERQAFWDKLYSRITGENGIELARQFTNYLKTLDHYPLSIIPKTDLKDEMVENSKSKQQRFWDDLISGFYIGLIDTYEPDPWRREERAYTYLLGKTVFIASNDLKSMSNFTDGEMKALADIMRHSGSIQKKIQLGRNGQHLRGYMIKFPDIETPDIDMTELSLSGGSFSNK